MILFFSFLMSRLSDSFPFSDFSFKVLNGSSIKAVYIPIELPKMPLLWQLL